jgi:hypothetical protein
MRRQHTLTATLAITALLLGAGSWTHAQISGQTPVPTQVPSGPTPRLANGRPDLTGVWQRPYTPDMTKDGRGQKGAGELPFTPAGLNDWKTYDATEGDYTGSCLPFGMSRSMNSPDPLQIMQSDKYISLLFEQNSWFHIVNMNREHPKNADPTWFGNSVGRWDGDTLVIDTTGFNGNTRLDTIGHPHSDGLHMIQTLLRTDAGHIAYTVTIDDPKAYTRPWKNERTWTLMNTEILEYSCEENNKDLRNGHIKFWSPPEKPKYR